MKKMIFILVMAVALVGLNKTCLAYNIGDDPGNPVPDDEYRTIPTGYPGEPFEAPANQPAGQGDYGNGSGNNGGAPEVSIQDIIDDAAAKAYKKAYDETLKQQWANPEDAKKHAEAAAAEAANAAVGGAKAGGLIDNQGNTTAKGAAVVAQAQAYVNQVYQALLSNFMAQVSPAGTLQGTAGGGPGQQPSGGADLNVIKDGVGLPPGQLNMPPAGQPVMQVTAYQILASGIPVGFYAPGEKVNISELSITYANRPGEVVSIVWGKVKDKDQWVPISFTANAALPNNQPGAAKAQVNYVNLTSDPSGGMSGVVQNPIAAYNTNSKNGGAVVVDSGWELTYAGKVETKTTQDGATISYITLTSTDAGHANYNGKTFITGVTKGQYDATFGNTLEPQPIVGPGAAVTQPPQGAPGNTNIQPNYAGVLDGTGPRAVTWANREFKTPGGITFRGFNEQEENAIRAAMDRLPPGLKNMPDIIVEKGGVRDPRNVKERSNPNSDVPEAWETGVPPPSYSGNPAPGNVIIIGEPHIKIATQRFANMAGLNVGDSYLEGVLVHELAHAWAGRNGPDKVTWVLGYAPFEVKTVGEPFVNLENAFANTYAATSVKQGKAAVAGAGFLDPANVIAANSGFGEDFANTVHEYYMHTYYGTKTGPIKWVDIDGNKISNPSAGSIKIQKMKELLSWK